ncbi:hypothetical protein HZA87_02630 [Candidatus Uhrbacteria bacterium]|nr:hypothetical protein [Candidatus Uhrbacteria bacterium]
MSDDLSTVCIRAWTSPDEQSVTLVAIPRLLYDALVAFVDRGAIPNDPKYASLVCDGRLPLTREERSAIAARIATERGTPAPVTTWTTVAY